MDNAQLKFRLRMPRIVAESAVCMQTEVYLINQNNAASDLLLMICKSDITDVVLARNLWKPTNCETTIPRFLRYGCFFVEFIVESSWFCLSQVIGVPTHRRTENNVFLYPSIVKT